MDSIVIKYFSEDVLRFSRAAPGGTVSLPPHTPVSYASAQFTVHQ